MDKAEQPTTQDDYQAIYLAPKCFDERVWCEHDAPVECQCDDGPHDWIKFHRTTSLAAQDGLVKALQTMIHAVCGETGFANAVRGSTGKAYPWPALDIAEEKARKALSAIKEQHHD